MTPADPRPAPSSVQVPHDVTSVAAVRRALAEALRAQGMDGHVVDDALIVVSELVANAVRHAEALEDGRVQASWTVSDGALEIAVTDGGSQTEPVADVATMASVGGRGLDIVRRLSRAWGVTDNGGSRVTVWATLPLPNGAADPR